MYYSLTWFDATLVYIFNECNRRSYNSESQPFNTLRHIFAKLKDPVESTPLILFLAMIGQTKRQFGTRLKEHQKAIFFLQKGEFSFIEAHMPN